MSSTMRKRTAAATTSTSTKDEGPEVILDAAEQEQVVEDLLTSALQSQSRGYKAAGILCIATTIVPFLLPSPLSLSILLLRLLTVPPLLYTSFTLLQPPLAASLSSALPPDFVLLPPILVALLVWYMNGDLLSQRTWGWTVPAAVVGLARETQVSLNRGVEDAQRMRNLLYQAPTA